MFDLNKLDIIRVESDNRMHVTDSGELIDGIVTIYARPKTEPKYIEVQITISPTGQIIN